MTKRPPKYLSVGDKGRVTIPEGMRSTLGVRKGDLLVYERTERGYEIMPATLVPADQRWFYHPEMQERIAGAERQIAAGEVTVLHSVDEVQAYLDRLKKPRPDAS